MPNVLATIGNHLSHILHQLVYAFPSPNSTDHSSSQDPVPNVKNGGGNMSGFEEMINEPGEPRALAGGIGPLSFAGSGYGVMLVLMAILLNRIHHIVRRPRPPAPPLPHPPVNSFYHRARRAVSRALVAHSTPKYLRLPGLVALLRAWVLFTILTLQVANLWPVDSPFLLSTPFGRAINSFGRWAGGMEMEKVCWQVFMSVCGGLVCSGLANGLDRGRRRDVGAGFNLFGYSFLLHLYSSPLTHHRPPPAATHGRPDVHALFQLWLSLTELTWLQAIELSSAVRRNQLIPTAVCGGMGLVHFVYALSTSPLKFPSFTFLTHLMALFLSIIIVFSVVLKAFTHLFTLGYLPSPIIPNLLPHEGVVPNIEDDFGVALLKLGTACIEATQFSGLRNELIAIEERQGPWVELSAADCDVMKPRRNYATGGYNTEITDIEVSELEDPQMESVYWREWRGFWYACGISIVSFLWSALVATPIGRKLVELALKGWTSRWWYGPRQWRFWTRDAWREPPQLRHERHQRLHRRIEDNLLRMYPTPEVHHEDVTVEELNSGSVGYSSAVRYREGTPAPGQWREILRGEVQVDDDDEDWELDSSSSSSGSSGASDHDEQNDLFGDLVAPRDHTPDSDLQPVLLAHLTNTSTPLTRRRYAAILSSPSHPPTPSAMAEIIGDRRLQVQGRERDEWDDDRRRCCVVCTIEPRDTILWPCRCLALCNDCRESLASRLAAKDHMCPCCRRKVDGYSRIFVP